MKVYSISDLPCAQAYSHFLEVQSKFSRYKSRNLSQGFSGDSCYLKNIVLSDWAQLNCSVTAVTSQLLKDGNCAAKPLPRASKGAQCFCIPLQLELSCHLASKTLLNSCNLVVQLFWSDFVALYSAASFVRGCSLWRPWKLGLRIVAWSKPCMFCIESLGNIKFERTLNTYFAWVKCGSPIQFRLRTCLT